MSGQTQRLISTIDEQVRTVRKGETLKQKLVADGYDDSILYDSKKDRINGKFIHNIDKLPCRCKELGRECYACKMKNLRKQFEHSDRKKPKPN